MSLFDSIAERRIAEAIARGELDDLPGAGKPLDLSEDPLVAEDLRMACRILKNAGFTPPELELRREIRTVEQLLETLDGRSEAGAQALRKLRLLQLELSESGRRAAPLDAGYRGRLLARLK